jgi:hypothetical protein
MTSLVTPTTSSAISFVKEPHLLGPSTGYMEDARGNFEELMQRVRAAGTSAAELSALSGPELLPLLAFFDEYPDRPPLVYISVHGPTKAWTGTTAELVEGLVALPPFVESIVLHPDSLDDASAFRPLGSRVLIENLDHRPETGRTPQELAPVFDVLPAAGFCLDLAHITAIDPSMRLANELLDAFGDRLREVHLSSFSRETAKHRPLTSADCERFAPVLRRCSGVPWILEMPFSDGWPGPG